MLEFLTLSTEHDLQYYFGWGLLMRGRSLIHGGQAQQGLPLLLEGLALLRAAGVVTGMAGVLTGLAQAYAMLGQRVEQRKWLAEAAALFETTDERMSEAEVLYRVPGDLLNAAGDRSGAEQHYLRAIRVSERQGARLYQLRASVSLAQLWRDQGKRLEARDLLAPIYNWFTEGFDAPDLKDARALLDQLAGGDEGTLSRHAGYPASGSGGF
jgi:tetratricopeptide (TPR) repeat protein